MKRTVFLLALVFAIAMAGCTTDGGTSPSPSTSATTSPTPPTTVEPGTDLSAEPSGVPSGDPSEDEGGTAPDVDTSGEPSGSPADPDYTGVGDVTGFFSVVEDAYETDLPSFMDLDDETLGDTYGVDPALLDEYVAKIPMMNVHATEFFAAKVKSGEMDAVLDGINGRLEQLDQTWSNYLPEQYDLVKNHQLVQEGDYVLLVIGTHAEQIAQSFRATFGETNT